MIYRVSLLCLLLASSVGLAQHPAITPSSHRPTAAKSTAITVDANKAADLSVTLGEGDSVLWQIAPTAPWKADNLPAGRVIFTGVPGTTYTVGVFTFRVVTDSAGKPTVKAEQSETTVTFLGAVPPPPPGPTPIPPSPNNDLANVLQAAYTADSSPTRAADLTNLRIAMSTAVLTASNSSLTTKEALVRQVNTDTKARVGTGKLNMVGVVIGDYLDRTMGTADAPLTDAVRQSYATAYRTVLDALNAVR